MHTFTHVRLRAWALWILTGVGLTVAYTTVEDPVAKATLVLPLSALATVVVCLRVARLGHAREAPWLLFAAIQLVWFLGWLLWELHIVRHGMVPAPESPVNLTFLLGDLALAALLLLLLRRREPDGIALVDAAIAVLALAIVAWVTLLHGYPGDANFVPLGRAYQIAYALEDVLVAGLLARLAISPGRRTPAFGLLLAAAAALLFSDGIWNWSLRFDTYSPGSWGDAGWLLFHTAAAAAVLHPSMSSLFAPACAPELERRTRWDRLALLAIAGLIAPAVLTNVPKATQAPLQTLPASVGASLLVLLVIVRLGLGLREQRRLAETLADQNERLLELDRFKDSFVASVSHELRTPLTSIRGYLDLVREGEAGDLTEEQEAYLGIVDRNADRLLRVVTDLLFVAQADAGSLVLDVTEVDLDALAVHAVDAGRPLAELRGIELSLVRADVPQFEGDASRIGQVLDNLVSNALKFTPGGGRVDVSVGALDGAARVEVRDTGMGLTPAEQERLFERFYRTESANEQAIQGTGLGLAIVKAIVDAHGGEIEVESTKGRGATFRVSFPLVRTKPRAALEAST